MRIFKLRFHFIFFTYLKTVKMCSGVYCMLKLIIVDDEFLIRDGLVRNVNWEQMGYEVVGSAENGAEALELIRQIPPDVVLTDIRMPFMDGFDLITQINREFPDISVIFISGHEEFAYAKRALSENACDYLLKPIHLDDLEKTMLRVKQEILDRRTKEASLEQMQETIAKVSPLLREVFLKDLLFGRLSSDDISTQAKTHSLPQRSIYQIGLIQIDDYFEDNSQSLFDRQNQLEIYFDDLCTKQNNCIIFSKSVNEYIFFCFSASTQALKNQVRTYAQQIMEWASAHFISLTISLGCTVEELAALHRSYQSALHTADLKFLRGGDRILYYEDLNSNPLTISPFSAYDIRSFSSSLQVADKQIILEEFDKLQADILQQQNLTNIMIQVICSNIFFEAKRIVEEQGTDIEGILPNATKVYQKLMDQPTAQAMFMLLKSIITTIVDYRDRIRFGKFTLEVEKAKQYIQDHYSEVSLNLKSLAKFVNMGACYFSVIFKKETGTTFIDYLTGIRLAKAKELLLSTNLKTYEISYQVGYDNPTFFSTLFKKANGQSPSEFRKSALNRK